MFTCKPRLLALVLSACVPAIAQDGASATSIDTGDNAWLLVCSALVLMMTGPGLALFYAGLVRKKNVLGTLMQSFIMMAFCAVLWVVVGYSLAFGGDGPWIGDLSHAFLNGVGADPSGYAPTVPHQTFMLFQMMFAIITPALITGAFAERMKFSALLIFCGLWLLIVYAPVCHWIWGSGGYFSLAGERPVMDFAGGVVVHITSGFAALVCALYLGKRLGYPSEAMKPHSLVLSVIGACLLWVGWFGFNGGSALSAGSLATSAILATHLGGAGGTITWVLCEWVRDRRPTVLGGITGAVAGLATITPASGFVAPMPALLIGLIAGFVCFYMVVSVKEKFGYDDSLDVFGVHGMGGLTGTLLAGLLASSLVNDIFGGGPVGLLEGNSGQFFNQVIGCAVGIAWTLPLSWALLKLTDVLVGVRMSQEAETRGMDLMLHGEEGYHMDME